MFVEGEIHADGPWLHRWDGRQWQRAGQNPAWTPPHYDAWTENKDQRLSLLWRAGCPSEIIAVSAGCNLPDWSGSVLKYHPRPVPLCCKEDWCAKTYEQWGGKPPIQRASLKERDNG